MHGRGNGGAGRNLERPGGRGALAGGRGGLTCRPGWVARAAPTLPLNIHKTGTGGPHLRRPSHIRLPLLFGTQPARLNGSGRVAQYSGCLPCHIPVLALAGPARGEVPHVIGSRQRPLATGLPAPSSAAQPMRCAQAACLCRLRARLERMPLAVLARRAADVDRAAAVRLYPTVYACERLHRQV